MKDRWSQLSLSEKSDLMSLYIQNGISSLEEIKKHYNSYQDGGKITFQQWKDRMKNKYPDIEMDNDKAGYNYEEYFNNNYDAAIRQLDNLQHFPDTYKLPNHPTFSNESMYSRGPMVGGNWINDSTFNPSIINRRYHPNTYREDRPYTEREIYNSFDTGGKLGKVTPYGQWQYPHQVTTIPSNNITMRGVNYPVVGVSNTGDTKVMLPNTNYEFDGEYVTEYPIHSFQKGGKLTRVRRNDSPTQASSESMEDRTARHIQNFKADKIDHNYNIPYIEEKEIVVPGVGRVSTNALDSIAKYSYLAGIPLEEGLGLAVQESAFGATPFLNYNKIPNSLPQEEKDRRAAANRALGNTSYFRNYGSIPANYLVRDWHYFDLTDEQREVTPPLLDAFGYWKAGKYNTNDKSHTEDVRTKGRQVIKTAPIQAWMQSSKYVKKTTTKKNKRR